MITIHTDGCCKNTKIGGYAAIIEFKDTVMLIGGHAVDTTNNQMELMGPIVALGSIVHDEPIDIFSDSQYFVDGFNSWMHKWQHLGWCLKKNTKAKNIEFWKSLFHLKSIFTYVHARWVKGHSDHVLNDICDSVANICCAHRLTININFNNIEDLIQNYERSLNTARGIS